jgi:glucose/arabinose dehydrogenase
LTRRAHAGLAAAVLALALVLAGCSAGDGVVEPTSTAFGPTGAALPVGDPVEVASGLVAPWSVAFAGDTALISERDTGRILELLPNGSTRVVGEVSASVPRGEGGLLGLAVDAEALYVFSTNEASGRIERYELSGAPGELSLGRPRTILSDLPAANVHNGGRLGFGPDGMLYASVGDAGDRASAQDLDALSGKILRMTPEGDVPDDNPFAGSLVYSYGHRNVQGIAWSDDGTMFASEFGQDTWDELNVIEPGGNYGWPDAEGAGGGTGFIDPVQQWRPDEASPSGIAVAGETIFIAGLRGQVLIAVPVTDPASSVDLFRGEYGRLRDVVSAPDGTLWFVTNNTDGRGNPRDGDDRVLGVELG